MLMLAQSDVAAGFKPGRGLKRDDGALLGLTYMVAAGFKPGRGLKP